MPLGGTFRCCTQLTGRLSQETLEYHWGKHHAAYVTNLNGQIKDTDMDDLSLEQVPVL